MVKSELLGGAGCEEGSSEINWGQWGQMGWGLSGVYFSLLNLYTKIQLQTNS